MTRLVKLYQKMLDGRPLSFVELEKLLSAFGYRLVRQRGSHRIWHNDGLRDSKTVQPKGRDAHEYQIEQFRAIIELHGLTLDQRND